MVFEAPGRRMEEEKQRVRDRWIGAYICALAVVLAICGIGGGNAAKEATLKTVEATNTWAFFQAKNMRRHALRLQVDELEILRDGQTGLTDAAKAAIDAKIAIYKAQDAALTSDEKKEGLDELYARGKELEVERDRARRQDPYFDHASALLQIAIVLASVAIVAGGSVLLLLSLLAGVAGALLTINGFTLAVALPWLG